MRLIALFCMLVVPVVAMAQNTVTPPSLRAQIAPRVQRAAWNARPATNTPFEQLVAKAKTTVRIQHQYQQDGYSSIDRAYSGAAPDRLFREFEDTTCSALLLNAKGLLAIKKDCVPVMAKDSGNYHGYFGFFVNLSKLGSFTNDVERYGEPLSYDPEERISLDSFQQPANANYILFYMPLNTDTKAALERLFPVKDAHSGKRVEITAEQAQRIMASMPKAKTDHYAKDESYLMH